MVSISRMVRSGTSAETTKIRAKPSNASMSAEAARPMMVDLKFKAQNSNFKEDLGCVETFNGIAEIGNG